MSEQEMLDKMKQAVQQERTLQEIDDTLTQACNVGNFERDDLYQNMRTRAKERELEELEAQRTTIKSALTLAELQVRMYTEELGNLDRKIAVL